MRHMRHKKLNSKDNKEMVLHKVVWKKNKYGSLVGKSEPYETGFDLVRRAYIKEVVPEQEFYYLRPNGEGNNYYLLHKGFSRKVDFQNIKDLVKAGCVYVKKGFSIYGQ